MTSKLGIKQIKRVNLVDSISEELLEKILDETFKVGEKLPPENTLAKLYNVSKFTIRLALLKLSNLGVTETINGDGTYVTEFSFENYVDQAFDVVYEEDMLDDVQVFRRMIELEAGRLAIENATDDEIDELIRFGRDTEITIYDPNKTLEENVNEFAQKDYSFHLKLCEISKNKLIYLSFIACKSAIYKYLYYIIETRTIKANRENTKIERFVTSSHVKLAETIKNRDYDDFKKKYLKMVNITDARN